MNLALEISGLRHAYGANEVLVNLSLSVARGEILGLIGENGAGKSTLVKCISGMLTPSAGAIVRHCSVAAIHQELNLADDLPVFANFFLGREIVSCGVLQRREMIKRTRAGLEAVGFSIDPSLPAGSLSASEKQLVEIAKALDVHAGLLILDEPTALLSTEETRRLFEIMRSLKAGGTSMIYISHRLAEIGEICDRVAILRDGELACTSDVRAMTQRQMAEAMVGRPLSNIYPDIPTPSGRTAFSYSAPGIGSFSIREGEIVGLAGLADAGQLEMCESIAGFREAAPGARVEVLGEERRVASPEDAAAAGIGFLSPDRLASGLWRNFSIADNIALGAFDRMTGFAGFASRSRISGAAHFCIREFNVRCQGADDAITALSGGNQQKVSIGKMLAAKPCIVMLCEPTQGVDVGARQEIYGCMARLAEKGIAALVVSSDMTELLGLCRRILVMREGRIAGELSGGDRSEQAIIRLATGT